MLLEMSEYFRGLIDEQNDGFGYDEAFSGKLVGQKEFNELIEERQGLRSFIVLTTVEKGPSRE